MLRTIRNAAVALTVATTLFAAAGPASAAVRTGSLTSSDGGARVTWKYDSYTGSTTGTLSDLKPNDAKCARVYSQGYNYVLGWGNWNLEKTVCAGGSAGFSHNPRVYSDKINLIVCNGYSNCVAQRIKG